MPQQAAPRIGLRVFYANESLLDVRVSEQTPPVPRGCRVGEEFKISDITPDTSDYLIEAEQLPDSEDAFGAVYKIKFKFLSDNIVYRSHYEIFPLLHSMGCTTGE
ncbi:hypothetical protein C8A03DRAFT_32038 [Achaetomium macrosporum]|uniref:Uncharacterized protein n=1 Tax=Achaetomium macrosporum TaxID=79813 RepID=A0AAN7CDN3_9PEZI|nr:hypothetical protein C8A03DRAFT_32038 [Achaetomium macrosporum]